MTFLGRHSGLTRNQQGNSVTYLASKRKRLPNFWAAVRAFRARAVCAKVSANCLGLAYLVALASATVSAVMFTKSDLNGTPAYATPGCGQVLSMARPCPSVTQA